MKEGGRFGRLFRCVKLWPKCAPSIGANEDGSRPRRAHGTSIMTNRRMGAATALALLTFAMMPAAAEAAWWNPFRHDDPQPQQVQPLPPPPDAAAVAPSPPADVGQPTQLVPQPQPQLQPEQPAVAQDQGFEQAVAAQAPGSPEELALRVERLEAKLRTMTGQIEELTHQVQQLQARLDGTQGTAAPAASAAPAANAAADPALSLDGSEDEYAMDAVGEDVPMDMDSTPALDAHGMVVENDSGPGAPPQPLGQVPADAPLDLSAAPASNGQQVASLVPFTGSARNDYETAYQYIVSGDYQLAEAGFRQFLANYPDDHLAADAQYWLGESLYTRGLYREAAVEFLAGYRSYPDSTKAPDTLLKLGLSLAGLGEREQACNAFSRLLQQYPDANNALLQRVRAEQAGASC
jgi:tol-pal system protein YbgF